MAHQSTSRYQHFSFSRLVRLGRKLTLRARSASLSLAAGGTTDTVARILALGMRSPLGQPLIIENVTGAGGSLGVARAARSTADGYSLVVGNWASHVGSQAIYPVQYDLLRDFAPVALLATTPLWIVARKTFPANDLRELILAQGESK